MKQKAPIRIASDVPKVSQKQANGMQKRAEEGRDEQWKAEQSKRAEQSKAEQLN